MKIATYFCFLFISVSGVFAQEIDQRLLSNYSQQELETMIATNSEQYDLLAYALDNALYVGNYSDSKGGEFQTISVDLNALPSFIELNIEIIDRNQYFKIEGEDKMLVVKSTIVLKNEMKK